MNRPITLVGRVPSVLGWLILRLGFAGKGRAFGPLSFWFVWQWITNRYYRLSTVRPGGPFKYRIATYRGKPLALADGTVVKHGDRVVDLHLDNATIAARLRSGAWGDQEPARTWRLAREGTEDMIALAAPGIIPAEVKALRGLTLLARASRRLGFEVHPLPHTWWNNLLRFFMLGLLTIYSPDGRRRLALVGRDAYPAEIWLGRRAFDERYGNMKPPPEPNRGR